MKWLCKVFGHKWNFRYEKCLRCHFEAKKATDDPIARLFEEAAARGIDLNDPNYSINIPVRPPERKE